MPISNDGTVELETVYIEPGSTQVRYAASDNPGKLVVVSMILPPAPSLHQDFHYLYPARFKELDPYNMKKWLMGGHDVAAFKLMYDHPHEGRSGCGLWGEITFHAGRGEWYAEVMSELPLKKSTQYRAFQWFKMTQQGIYDALAWFNKELTDRLKLMLHCGFDADKAQATPV